jgi:transcription elongation factor Elf1
MSEALHEQGLDCPHCGERITVLLDLSAGDQSYVEDCEVCCAPMSLSYEVEEGELVGFSVEPC